MHPSLRSAELNPRVGKLVNALALAPEVQPRRPPRLLFVLRVTFLFFLSFLSFLRILEGSDASHCVHGRVMPKDGKAPKRSASCSLEARWKPLKPAANTPTSRRVRRDARQKEKGKLKLSLEKDGIEYSHSVIPLLSQQTASGALAFFLPLIILTW